MLQGAIIGAVVGMIMTIVMARQKKKGTGKVLGTLASEGQAAARAALDEIQPPMAKIKASRFQHLQERVAALAIINDTAALRSEVDAFTGMQNVVVQLQGLGLLGLALRADDPAPIATELAALRDTFEKDAGKLAGLVKRNLRIFADLAAHLDGGSLTEETRLHVGKIAMKDSMMSLILHQAMGRHHAAVGKQSDAADCFAVVNAKTNAFE